MKQPFDLRALVDHELHFICAQDHISTVAVSDLLGMTNAPTNTLQAAKRAVCRRWGQPANDFWIVFATRSNNDPRDNRSYS
jgi:hypothetical protein